jgi:hypothetical protein
MSLGLHDRQARARRQLIWGLVRWAVALALIGLAGLFAYKTGSTLAELDVSRLQTQLTELQAQIQSLRNENATLKATVATSAQQAKEWQQRFSAEVPTGDAKAVLDLAQKKLAQGVDVARLRFLIDASSNPRVCDAEPETKRFTVRTPIGKPSRDSATTLANKQITVTADGQPEVNTNGRKEAWFDPAQPVTVKFAELGGKATEATGILPVQHSVVIGDSEFRFTVAADDKRGFVAISAIRCNYP